MKLSTNTITQRMQRFEEKCKEAGLPLTAQRVAVFQYLANTTSHPTAQMIYQDIKKTIANISLATIYKNLDKLIELGLARKLILQDGSARFDAEMSEHHHIINLDSNEILDLDANIPLQLPASMSQFRLETASVNYYVRN